MVGSTKKNLAHGYGALNNKTGCQLLPCSAENIKRVLRLMQVSKISRLFPISFLNIIPAFLYIYSLGS